MIYKLECYIDWIKTEQAAHRRLSGLPLMFSFPQPQAFQVHNPSEARHRIYNNTPLLSNKEMDVINKLTNRSTLVIPTLRAMRVHPGGRFGLK